MLLYCRDCNTDQIFRLVVSRKFKREKLTMVFRGGWGCGFGGCGFGRGWGGFGRGWGGGGPGWGWGGWGPGWGGWGGWGWGVPAPAWALPGIVAPTATTTIVTQPDSLHQM